MTRGVQLLLGFTLIASTSCAPHLAALPSGPGRPFPEFAAAYASATEPCRGVKTMAAILAISGRVAGHRFRAKIDAGFATPARVRLEMPAPGKPLFTFVADGDEATLVLPRDGRVLQKASSTATLEALAGVAVGPADLRSIVSGCGVVARDPSGARAFDGGWAAIDGNGATNWLQQINGAWRVAAATRGTLQVTYADYAGARPGTIHLRATPDRVSGVTDLTIRLSQVDIDTALGPEVFQVDIPTGATPMTLDELRQAGPLGR